MYKWLGFEELLKKWTDWDVTTDIILDIYNRKIWKYFPLYIDISISSKFFTHKKANFNLEIMINLNWFQLFESLIYSCEVIYGIICNLPYDIRFKKENILTLGLLLESNEVKLEQINHYLAPIIDELLEL